MREIYKSVHKYGDLGIPLGCLIETDPIRVVAFEAGGTFSTTGIQRLHADLRSYEAHLSLCEEPVDLRAIDVAAVEQFMAHHYNGRYQLFVTPSPIDLGEFGKE